MEHKVAEFIPDSIIAAGIYCICQLIGFLNSQLAEAFIGLLHIPWAGISELINNVQEFIKLFCASFFVTHDLRILEKPVRSGCPFHKVNSYHRAHAEVQQFRNIRSIYRYFKEIEGIKSCK